MKSPAFQFYPTDYLASQRVQMMTLEEEGAYFRLLCYCWQHGDIPADPDQAARLIGKGASTTLARVVLAMFQPIDGTDRMNHDRLEAERAKQAAWREKSAAGGRKSAEKRKGASTTLEPPLEGCLRNGVNQKATLHLQSSSSSPSSIPIPSTKPDKVKERFSKPSPEEVDAYVAAQGYKVNGHAFVDFYESKGWKVGAQPMKDWQAAVRTWHRKAETAGQPSAPKHAGIRQPEILEAGFLL